MYSKIWINLFLHVFQFGYISKLTKETQISLRCGNKNNQPVWEVSIHIKCAQNFQELYMTQLMALGEAAARLVTW
jgi:hypothetical protein